MSRTRSRTRPTSNLKVSSFTWSGTTKTCVRKNVTDTVSIFEPRSPLAYMENKQEV